MVPFSRSIATCAARGSSNWTKPKLRRRTGGSARRPCFAKILSISAMFVFSVAKLPMNTLQYGGNCYHKCQDECTGKMRGSPLTHSTLTDGSQATDNYCPQSFSISSTGSHRHHGFTHKAWSHGHGGMVSYEQGYRRTALGQGTALGRGLELDVRRRQGRAHVCTARICCPPPYRTKRGRIVCVQCSKQAVFACSWCVAERMHTGVRKGRSSGPYCCGCRHLRHLRLLRRDPFRHHCRTKTLLPLDTHWKALADYCSPVRSKFLVPRAAVVADCGLAPLSTVGGGRSTAETGNAVRLRGLRAHTGADEEDEGPHQPQRIVLAVRHRRAGRRTGARGLC